MAAWIECNHKFNLWFGPVLKCRKCGATTMMTSDPNESKPIWPSCAAECETHDLYKTGDEDAPEAIKDRNGEVVLSMCRRCGRAESELTYKQF